MWNRSLISIAVACALSFHVRAQAGAPLLPQEEEFLEWAVETATPVDLSRAVPDGVLAPWVAGKRFVYLGEPDHYIHEKYTFRLAFLETLHGLGWRRLGMEMGRADGLRFDRFLESGDERDLGRIALYAQAGSRAADSDRGGFFGMEFEYARRVRGIGGGAERLHYFGFDLDLVPGKGLEDARGRLADVPGVGELDLLLREAWAETDPLPMLLELLAEVQEPDSELVASLDGERRRELALDLWALTQSLIFTREVNLFGGDLGDDFLRRSLDGFAQRERGMFGIMDGLLDGLPADERIVLTGHNMHLSRDGSGARWSEMGSEVTIPLWPTIGAHLARAHPDEVFAIWLVYDQGQHLDVEDGYVASDVPSVPGTLESLLARRFDRPVFLPLASDDPRSRWLDDERTFRVNGGLAHGHLRRLTDAVVFVPTARPPRPRR